MSSFNGRMMAVCFEKATTGSPLKIVSPHYDPHPHFRIRFASTFIHFSASSFRQSFDYFEHHLISLE
jgi:hypothetical protein